LGHARNKDRAITQQLGAKCLRDIRDCIHVYSPRLRGIRITLQLIQ
jgi:hypothetical protein